MINYKYLTWFSKHVPRHSREDFVPRRELEASKTCRSCRVLSATLDYFRLRHWIWKHPSGILFTFISKGRMLSQLERLHPTTNKWEDHMISSDSFFLNNGNRTKNGFNLLATRSSTRPALLDLGGTGSPFWKRGFKVPNMEPEFQGGVPIHIPRQRWYWRHLGLE